MVKPIENTVARWFGGGGHTAAPAAPTAIAPPSQPPAAGPAQTPIGTPGTYKNATGGPSFLASAAAAGGGGMANNKSLLGR